MRAIERFIQLCNLKTVYSLSCSFLECSERNRPGHVKAEENEALVAAIWDEERWENSLGYENALESLCHGKVEKAAGLVHSAWWWGRRSTYWTPYLEGAGERILLHSNWVKEVVNHWLWVKRSWADGETSAELQAEILVGHLKAGIHPTWCKCLQLGQLFMAHSTDNGDVVNRANEVTCIAHILRIRLIAPDSLNALV